MVFNNTGLTNISGIQGLASYTNNATSGILFTGGMITLFIVLLFVLLKNEQPFENAFAASSWAMFIISSLFWLAELVPTLVPLGFLLCAGISVLILASRRN